MIGQGNLRSMPSDFHEHANEGITKLMTRYRAGAETVRRWKALCGTLRPWGRAAIRIDDEGNEKRFASVGAAAASVFNGDRSNIYHAIRTNRRAYGYYWRYEE